MAPGRQDHVNRLALQPSPQGCSDRIAELRLQNSRSRKAIVMMLCLQYRQTSSVCAGPSWGQPARDKPAEADYPGSVFQAMLHLPDSAPPSDPTHGASREACSAGVLGQAGIMRRAFNKDLEAAARSTAIHARLRALHTKGRLHDKESQKAVLSAARAGYSSLASSSPL